jgi:hypothetical protein
LSEWGWFAVAFAEACQVGGSRLQSGGYWPVAAPGNAVAGGTIPQVEVSPFYRYHLGWPRGEIQGHANQDGDGGKG